MKKWKLSKNDLYKTLVIVMLFVFAGTYFYWKEIRPSQIKHDCSWVKEVKEAQPEFPAMTESELREKGIVKACPTPLPIRIYRAGEYYDENLELESSRIFTDTCIKNNNIWISKYKTARDAVPEEISWRKATGGEYKFCLRDKGL